MLRRVGAAGLAVKSARRFPLGWLAANGFDVRHPIHKVPLDVDSGRLWRLIAIGRREKLCVAPRLLHQRRLPRDQGSTVHPGLEVVQRSVVEAARQTWFAANSPSRGSS